MRRVKITGTPPQDWVEEAEAVTQQLRAAVDGDERKAIIDANDGLWRDDRIRDWLLGQFNSKCWYSEAQDSVSSIHVDHYRPKGRVKNELGALPDEGYWWLAFEWTNYRICGQLLNVKKGDLFPVVEGGIGNAGDQVSLQLEAPVLIDPLTDDARLISFEKDEGACMAVAAAGVDELEKFRAEKTIEILGLNLRYRLNKKRADYWDACMGEIEKYRGAQGPQVIKCVTQASAMTRLKEMVAYNEEFSSVSEACIRKNAPEPLVAKVFDPAPV